MSDLRGTRVGPSERCTPGRLPLAQSLPREDCQALRHVMCSRGLPLFIPAPSSLRSSAGSWAFIRSCRSEGVSFAVLWLSCVDGELIAQGPEPGAWVPHGERGLGAPPSSSRAFCAQPSSLALAARFVPRRCQQECAHPLLTVFSATCWTDVWGFVRDWFGIILSFLDPKKLGLLHRAPKPAPLTAVPGLKVAAPSFRALRL